MRKGSIFVWLICVGFSLLHCNRGDRVTGQWDMPPPAWPPSGLDTLRPRSGPGAPKNVVIIQGDGMGIAHLEAASLFAHGVDGALAIQNFPFSAVISTQALGGDNRDSASGASAMATGKKGYPMALSMDIKTGVAHATVLEVFAVAGKKTGLVTSSYIYDASPAAFTAHAPYRYNFEAVVKSICAGVKPDVIFGGNHKLDVSVFVDAGYLLMEDTRQLQSATDLSTPVAGIFWGELMPTHKAADFRPGAEMDGPYPSLQYLTQTALALLDDAPNGFFLFLEEERIDEMSHENHLDQMVHAVLVLDEVVQHVRAWAEARPENDTLILVVADHETGGLVVKDSMGKGHLPKINWKSKEHTSADVQIFAWGPGAERLKDVKANTDVFSLMVE